VSGRRSLAAGVVLAAVVALPACAPPSADLPPVRIELVALADAARPIVEELTNDIGDPAIRGRLWSGWGPDESAVPSGRSFSWSAGVRSRLVLDLVEPRPMRLRLRGWPYPFAGGEPQRVRVLVNGSEVGDRALRPGEQLLDLRVSASELRPGENLLEIENSRVHRAEGEPPWASGWDGVSLADDGVATAGRPVIDRDGGRLLLPARTALAWAFELPGGAYLAWDGLTVGEGARFVVDLLADGEAERSFELAAGDGPLRLTPEREAVRLVGIRLRAVGESGAVEVAGPRIHLPERSRPAPPVRSARPRRPNLLVYLIDTLRPDRLGCYGLERPTSPAIDRFAAGAVRWIEARAQAPWTKPAVATLLTGLYPVAHRAQGSWGVLREEVETIAERLAPAGYQSAMFTANSNTSHRFGFAQGWDHFELMTEGRGRAIRHLQSFEMTAPVVEWLDGRDPERPFLLVVHTIDPHDSYTPGERFRHRLAPGVDPELGTRERLAELGGLDAPEAEARARELLHLYDAEIAQNDESFGELLAALDARGLGDDTAVLLVSDHGEEFLEHGGWKHGFTLYEEQLRIPLILRLPDGERAGTVLPGPVEQIDVVPTLLDLAGVGPARELPGRSLLDELEPGLASPRPSFAWLERQGTSLSAVTFEQWKLIRTTGAWEPPAGRAPALLFGLGTDPGERDDQALGARLRRLWLGGSLAAAEARWAAGGDELEAPRDTELEEGLRALGYL